MSHKNNPPHGKEWIHLGFIRMQDKPLVEKKMKQYKIPTKIQGNMLHAKEDPRHKQYIELFVRRGFRREAMKVMKVLFAEPSHDVEDDDNG